MVVVMVWALYLNRDLDQIGVYASVQQQRQQQSLEVPELQ